MQLWANSQRESLILESFNELSTKPVSQHPPCCVMRYTEEKEDNLDNSILYNYLVSFSVNFLFVLPLEII